MKLKPNAPTLLAFNIVILIMLLVTAPAYSQNPDLAVGVTGQTTLTGWENPVTLLRREAVQKAILQIAEEPKSYEQVEAMIEGEPFGVDALIDAWVLDERDGRLYINFNLVTGADGPVLQRIREVYGRSLADEVIERWETIDNALEQYDLKTVPKEMLAYILVGAFSLDWDGLGLTVEQDWREVALERPNGDVFHVWAEERPEPDVLKGLFWGSHNHTEGDLRITTFGDHYAVPRKGFPDLAWQMYADFGDMGEAFQESLYPGSAVVARDGVLNWVASTMPLLRDGPKSTSAIAEQIQRPENRVGYVMEMLKAVGYVEETESGWVSLIPVLGERDMDMTRTILINGREAMLAWGGEHIEDVFADMEALVAVRQGVKPEVMMTKVWHHIFAGANTALIEEGLLADPYGKPDGFEGFFPVVWHILNNPDTLVGAEKTEVNPN